MTSFEIDAAHAFQLAIEASPTGILIATPDGRILLVNRAVERQFGYARHELVGQTVDLLVSDVRLAMPPAPLDVVVEAPDAAVNGRELSGRRKDGSTIPIEIRWQSIPSENGRLVLASIEDVGERRQRERCRQLAIERQLAFDRLVTELSTRFINLPAPAIDEAIGDALGRISVELDVDRSALYELGPDGTLNERASWNAPNVPRPAATDSATARFSWAIARLLAAEIVSVLSLREIPDEMARRAWMTAGMASAALVPLSGDGRLAGTVAFETVGRERDWPPEVVDRLKVLGAMFGQVLATRRRDAVVSPAVAELERVKNELQAENTILRQTREWTRSTHVVGRSVAVRSVMEQIQQVAPTDSTVLLLGETGTGKELFATQIHELSPRSNRPMVRVNCAAIPSTLIESELFGREKGAFTGALARQVGRFELANHSTLFLDEIGDLPQEVQIKLLRALEERQIERLGSPQPIAVNTRVIAATHQNLEQKVADGTFRQDLFYRLNVFPVRVPTLRERIEDIPPLVWWFVEDFSQAFGKRIESIAKENLAALQQYSWPGNIRELRNSVERAMIAATGPRLTIVVPPASAAATKRSPKLVDVEKEHIRTILHGTGWRIRGTGGAAERLGLKPTTLETRMAKLGLKRPGHA